MSDGNPQLVAALQAALDSLNPRHTLMVIPQPAELQQYLRDSLRAARSPAAIVLNISDPVIEALVAWIRAQRNAIADIPIVGIGASPRAPLCPNQIDAAVTAPTTALLEDALGRVMKKHPPRSRG